MKRLVAIALLTSLMLAACGSGGSEGSDAPGMAMPEATSFDAPIGSDVEAYPVVVSAEIVVGKNRFLVGLLNDEDAPIGSPDIELRARFFDLETSTTEPATAAELGYIESIPGQRGLYVGQVTFDTSGKWGAEVDIDGEGIDETVRTSFEVLEEGSTPAIGARAPASDTATADDVKKLSEITTDPRPDPDFYELSIRDALKQSRPFVVAFATPKFCTSQVCGPTLNIVKKVSRGFPELTFIHVEVYENLDDPSNLIVVDAVNEWKLPTEPWVFVVDGRGRIAAKYEGTVSPGELRSALKKL